MTSPLDLNSTTSLTSSSTLTTFDNATSQYTSTTTTITHTHSGLSHTQKAILGGVLGGIGGLGLICVLILLYLSKRRQKRQRQPVQATPQRMTTTRTPVAKFMTSLCSSSKRSGGTSVRRTPKRVEEESPTAERSFKVLSGRKQTASTYSSSSPHAGSNARRSIDSRHSSLQSANTTPSRVTGYSGSPSMHRTRPLPDVVGRSQDAGSTTSHMSRFIERIDDV